MKPITSAIVVVLLCALSFTRPAAADDYNLHRFQRLQLTADYYSEGCNIGDVNQDGVIDVVSGPYWYAGPEYKTKHEIYPPKLQPLDYWADNFFSWVHDFNGDGWNDVLTVGFPGDPAYVYENPTNAGFDTHWQKHTVFDWVSNESPQFTQIVGDERPELICTRDGYFGYASVDWSQPFKKWIFHQVSSRQLEDKRWGHGLGVGDVDGDGRLDLLHKEGWYEQPDDIEGDPLWTSHAEDFATVGGAEMYAYDCDGDGDNDVITSLEAHDYGLAWYEQIRQDGDISFEKHLIMGRRREENQYGVLFTELHSVNLVDMDGDGLKDIVTGKTYWSHHKKSPMWDAGAVVYWFKLVRDEHGVDWVPWVADGESGIGRQLIVGDVNGDQLPDIVAGGMKGCHVLIHQLDKVDQRRWQAAQPKPYTSAPAGQHN